MPAPSAGLIGSAWIVETMAEHTQLVARAISIPRSISFDARIAAKVAPGADEQREARKRITGSRQWTLRRDAAGASVRSAAVGEAGRPLAQLRQG